jgi:hypothetical protein
MYHPDEDVQDIIDLAFDSNRNTESLDYFAIMRGLENLPIRDEILALAIDDTDESYQLLRFIGDYSTHAPDGQRANPAIIASIGNYIHGNKELAGMYYTLCMCDNPNNNLAYLFDRLLDVGTSPFQITGLITKAVNGE